MRIQRLPSPLFCGAKINDPRFGINYSVEVNGQEIIKFCPVHKDENGNMVPFTAESAYAYVQEAEKRGVFVHASGPIPVNKNEHGVFAFSRAGKGVDLFNTKCYMVVRKAAESLGLTGQQIIRKESGKNADFEEEIPTQKISSEKSRNGKDDPMRIIVTVEFTSGGKPYTYRANETHFPGDFVCVKDADEKLKNVRVLSCETHPESWIAAKAKEIGYSDIAPVFSDQPEETEEAWAEYRASEQEIGFVDGSDDEWELIE